MRSTDRDYCVSTIAVLQDQLRIVTGVVADMAMRLDELDDTLLYAYAQKEDEETDELMEDSWESGYNYRAHLADKAAEYEPPSPKLCLCDECWDVTNDQGDCDCDECRCKSADPWGVSEDSGETKKEYFDWIDDVLRRTRRAPQDYRMD